MEDMERYGDYDEVDDSASGVKNPVITALKILIVLLCFAVVGFLAFRVIFFNYYPKAMKSIYFNEALTEHYNVNNGAIEVTTQSMRAPYDDPDEGNFFADNLIIIENAGQLQLSVRYNSAAIQKIEEEYGIALGDDIGERFSFTLERVPYAEDELPHEIGELTYQDTDSKLMYSYHKLVFDGVEFLSDDANDWIRLVIRIKDVPNAKPYYILVYERSGEYNKFTEYEIKKGDRP